MREDVYKILKRLLTREPLKAVIISSGKIEIRNDIKSSRTRIKDMKVCIEISESQWSAATEEEKVWIIEHEVNHILNFHHTNYQNFDPVIVSIAMDAIVNSQISKTKIPDYAITKEVLRTIGVPYQDSTIKYYEILKKMSENEVKKFIKGISEDGETKVGGKTIRGTEPCEQCSLEEIEPNLIAIKNAVKLAIDTCKGYSTDTSFYEELIKNININSERKIDWKKYLSTYISSSNKKTRTPTKSRVNRRMDANPGIRTKKGIRILVAVDTSGSMSSKEIKEVYEEIKFTARNGNSCHVIQSDAAIKDIRKFKKAEEVQITGRGGTNYQPIIDMYNKDNGRKYDKLVYFTDGLAPAPKNEPKMLWVITGGMDLNKLNFKSKTIKL